MNLFDGDDDVVVDPVVVGQGVEDVKGNALNADPVVDALHEVRGDGERAGLHGGAAQRVTAKIALPDENDQNVLLPLFLLVRTI